MLTGGPAPSMCTSSSGPMAATEGAPGCRVRVSVAILESATTPAASTDKIAGSDSPPPRSGPGRIMTTVGGGSGVSIGKIGTAVSPCRQADTARTLSCGWGAGGGGPTADTRARIGGDPGGVCTSLGPAAKCTRRLFSGRRGALSDTPVRTPSDGDSLSRELQSHRA